DVLKQEEREEQPAILLTVTDTDGNIVERITGPTSAGFHRVAWDLRYAPITGGSGRGPLVTPGKYRVNAVKILDDVTTPMGDPRDVEVVAIEPPSLPARDRAAVLAFQKKAGELQRALVGANRRLEEALQQLADIKTAIRRTPQADLGWRDEARNLERRLLDLRDQLAGDETRNRRSQTAPPSVMRRAEIAYEGSLSSTYGPTQTHRQQYEIAAAEYKQMRKSLVSLLDTNLVQLKKKLDDAGVPWTPGRSIPESAP
ncbi:MAG: glycosyl hydrolase, partial [Planctomycetes bacterium]|nr:glycosyl hydrolase [Planctomycetota bacterium]